MIDSHCHLADAAFGQDLEVVAARAQRAGVTQALCILGAGDADESASAARVRRAWPAVRFAVGIHPHQAGRFSKSLSDLAGLVRQAVAAEGALAVGEIGLDYHYDFSPRNAQRQVFAAQIALAGELDLPVVIHTREATPDTFDVLRESGQGRIRGVFHCFTGDVLMARQALDIGFFISLAGIVTFPRAEVLREVARFVPDDRLLIETDSPYLAPLPHRGKRNEPAYVTRIGEAVADVRGVSASDLAAALVRNFEAFLGPNVSLQTA